jgi:signal transduction histidine kinase
MGAKLGPELPADDAPRDDPGGPPGEGRASLGGRMPRLRARATVPLVNLRIRPADILVTLVATALALVLLFAHGFGEPEPDVRDGDALGVVLVLASTLPLLLRRAAPWVAFALSATAIFPLHLLEYPGELGLVPAIALFELAASTGGDAGRSRLAAALAALAFFAVLAVPPLVDESDGAPATGLLAGGAIWAAAWLAGDRARLRRERIAALEERTRRAEREAERERRLAAAEERTRIARELHDSAGHAINVILVQAGAARLLRDRDPEASTKALETIEEVARDTIGEIDRLVHALRENAEPPRAPLGLGSVEELAERHRSAGLPVHVEIGGAPRRLSGGVDAAAYRIIQEALLNAARHGDGGPADVRVRFGPTALEVTVTNPARNGTARRAGGHGITGMRERANLLGGRLEAATHDGEFRVHAQLPYETRRA